MKIRQSEHELRHSAAHTMAEAILKLYPEAQLHIGPATEEGFFYDVLFPSGCSLSSEDLGRIEQEMKLISRRDAAFVRKVLSRQEALDLFKKLNQPLKVARISKLDPDEEITIYDQGEFVDLCRGPHVERTGRIKHFKLTRVNGVHFDGDSSGEQMQRVHGVVFPSREELKAWKVQQVEAARRDHRKVGKKLELFMTSPLSPGAVFWLPAGEALYHTMQTAMRTFLLGEGYVAVNTPLIMDHELWKTSGHLEHYHENMFHVITGDELKRGEKPHRGLKPMNCPCHMLIFANKRRSYRELPLRIHDQGVLHRNEFSGVLGGLTRVRQFCQDDAHIFCSPEQILDEVLALIGLVKRLYEAFDLGFSAELSTRPEDRLGEEALWDEAEQALRGALEAAKLPHEVNEGDGAFYGPKIDFKVKDAIGRSHQCATIQLDFQLPRNFKLKYAGPDGEDHIPVVIHRAIFGSFERFLGILIEHYEGAFPAWLAPEVVRVAPISEKFGAYGAEVLAALKRAGIRASLDNGQEKIGKKVRSWRGARVPYIAVVGEQEQGAGTVALRSREGKEEALSVQALVEQIVAEMKVPFLSEPGEQG